MMKKTQEKSNNSSHKNRKKEIKVRIPRWISVIIMMIALIEILFLVVLFVTLLNNKISADVFGYAAESSLLASGLAIIGMAISVWAGLNIIHAFERKEYDNLKNKTQIIIENTEEIEGKLRVSLNNLKEMDINRLIKYNESAKTILLYGLSKTISDIGTRKLMDLISIYNPEKNVSIIELVTMEYYFSLVYSRHSNIYAIDNTLLRYADKGIEIANNTLSKTKDKSLKTYLNFRIAEFKYYSAYCLTGEDKDRKFKEAIDLYFQVKDGFNCNIPDFKHIETKNLNTFEYEGCSKGQLDISAYMCNSIGDAYSKIIQGSNDTDLLSNYGPKAIFYCAYASHWVSKELYWRNLGVAIERSYGHPLNLTKEIYDIISPIYRKAFECGCNESTLKVNLSLMDKHINYILGIGYADKDKGRTIKLCDESYFNRYNTLDTSQRKFVNSILEDMYKLAQTMRIIFPSKQDSYIYSCLYWRDKVVIEQNNSLKNEYLNFASKELQYLMILSPNGVLTKILKMDIDDLTNSVREQSN